jgi:trk system potassium uptake protein TrkA
VAAIFRRDRPILPQGDTVIEADDEVFFIAAKANIRAVMSEMRRLDETYKRIVIAGGGQIGERLAEAIESRYQVKIIEMSPARCRHLSDTLDSTVVLQGSASDRDLLLEENIADADIFLALTNDDEANIMSSLLAKRLGAKKVMTIINNPAYVDLIQGGDIDIAISPQLATIGTLLARAPWRYRQRALTAPGRGGSHRGDCPRRCEVEQGHRQGHREHRPAAGPPSARSSATKK